MTDKPYPSRALTDIARQLLDDWGLSLAEIANLAADLHGEAEAINKERSGPTCDYCGRIDGLRYQGLQYGAPVEFICWDCFTPRDDGPCFDDLPEA